MCVGGTVTEPFIVNCRTAEYNAEYSRLQMLLHDGLIDPEHYLGNLKELKERYSDILKKGE